MRKHTKEEKIVEHTIVDAECQLCGRSAYCALPNAPGVDWEDTVRTYKLKETQVSCQVGYSWPDDACGTVTWFDICPECFLGKLVPWMKEQGADPEIESY